MPQLKHEIPRFPVHLTCPHCLMPMHIRWAEVLIDRSWFGSPAIIAVPRSSGIEARGKAQLSSLFLSLLKTPKAKKSSSFSSIQSFE